MENIDEINIEKGMAGSKYWKFKKVENGKNLFLLMKKKNRKRKKEKLILKIMNSRKKMRKSVKSKENGD